MRPKVATILSAQPWEQQFADTARNSGGVRLVCRAYDPGDLPSDVEVIIGGSETSWMTPACVKAWQGRGIRVIGIHPATDAPGRQLFETAGADAVLSALEPPEVLLGTARSLAAFPSRPLPGPRITVVSGPAGAPGRTECAVAIARLVSRKTRTLLIDLDDRSPSVALRLGLPPFPNIDDAGDETRATGRIPFDAIQAAGDMQVLAGTIRSSRLDPRMRRDILWAARGLGEHIVVDAGAPDEEDPILEIATDTILVCDASPIGLVRAATLAAWWRADPPRVLLNRMGTDQEDMLRACRHALGLEPWASIAYDPEVRRASVRAEPSPERFIGQLESFIS